MANRAFIGAALLALLAGCGCGCGTVGDQPGTGGSNSGGSGDGGSGDGGSGGDGGTGGGDDGTGGGTGGGGGGTGGGTGGTPPPPEDPLADDLAALATDFDALAAALGPLGPTAAVPTAGQATYKGTAEMQVGDGAAVLYGEARVSIDFADLELSGRLDGFMGQVGDGPVQVWEGRIGIDEGSQPFTGVASGTLDSGGTTLTLAVPLAGTFLGGAAQGVAVAGTGEGSIGGQEAGVALAIWGEQVWLGE